MGDRLEVRVKKRARRNAVRNALLATIALVPVLTVAMAAPKVLSLIDQRHIDHILPRNPKQRIRENISRLKKRGLITFEDRNGKKYLQLTPAGRQALNSATLKEGPVVRPRRWDRKWRFVIFDIPEDRKVQRNRIRELVRGFGFTRVQDSVWAYPYDCEDIVTLLKAELRTGRDMLYLIVDVMDYDRPLRQHFNLPLTD